MRRQEEEMLKRARAQFPFGIPVRKYPPTVPLESNLRYRDIVSDLRWIKKLKSLNFAEHPIDPDNVGTIVSDNYGRYTFGTHLAVDIHQQLPLPIFQDYRTPPPLETSNEWIETTNSVFMGDIDVDTMSDFELDSSDDDYWDQLDLFSTFEDFEEFSDLEHI